MYTISQVANSLDVSDSTLRKWGDDFADHLSAAANPPKGETRLYGEGDVAVLRTVATLRARHVPLEEIHERLDAGERLELPEGEPAPAASSESPAGDNSETALVTESFAAALQQYDGQIGRLQDRVDELQDRLVDAEKRATAAETELRILREQQDTENATAGAGRRPWWRLWER